MKTTFSKRYKIPISSCHLCWKHSRPKMWIQLPTACWAPWWAENTANHLRRAHFQLGEARKTWRVLQVCKTKCQNEYRRWRTLNAQEVWFFKWERAISDPRIHWWTEIWRVPGWSMGCIQTWERNFRREEKGMKEVIKTPGLQAWESCRTTDSCRGSQLGKMTGLVWDILSFKQWQNNPKRMSIRDRKVK